MIEVEKKFSLNDQEKERLTQGAQFIGERVFTDAYYDTPDFSLTLKDIWLRSREGRWELKVPLHEGADRMADQYDELEDEKKTREALGLVSGGGTFVEDLARSGHAAFCTCKTTRRKYKHGQFTIDLDTVDFQDFSYTLAEIELMVGEKSAIEGAIEKIMAFAKERNLTIAPVRGKVIEYLKRMKQAHYQALARAGVIKDF